MAMFEDNMVGDQLSYQSNLVRVSGRVDTKDILDQMTGSFNQVYLVGFSDAEEWDKYLWDISTQQWVFKGTSRLMLWDDKVDKSTFEDRLGKVTGNTFLVGKSANCDYIWSDDEENGIINFESEMLRKILPSSSLVQTVTGTKINGVTGYSGGRITFAAMTNNNFNRCFVKVTMSDDKTYFISCIQAYTSSSNKSQTAPYFYMPQCIYEASKNETISKCELFEFNGKLNIIFETGTYTIRNVFFGTTECCLNINTSERAYSHAMVGLLAGTTIDFNGSIINYQAQNYVGYEGMYTYYNVCMFKSWGYNQTIELKNGIFDVKKTRFDNITYPVNYSDGTFPYFQYTGIIKFCVAFDCDLIIDKIVTRCTGNIEGNDPKGTNPTNTPFRDIYGGDNTSQGSILYTNRNVVGYDNGIVNVSRMPVVLIKNSDLLSCGTAYTGSGSSSGNGWGEADVFCHNTIFRNSIMYGMSGGNTLYYENCLINQSSINVTRHFDVKFADCIIKCDYITQSSGDGRANVVNMTFENCQFLSDPSISSGYFANVIRKNTRGYSSLTSPTTSSSARVLNENTVTDPGIIFLNKGWYNYAWYVENPDGTSPTGGTQSLQAGKISISYPQHRVFEMIKNATTVQMKVALIMGDYGTTGNGGNVSGGHKPKQNTGWVTCTVDSVTSSSWGNSIVLSFTPYPVLPRSVYCASTNVDYDVYRVCAIALRCK